MNPDKPDYVALYGNVLMTKSYCDACGTYAFVLRGRLQCCDMMRYAKPQFLKRETMPEHKRVRPSTEMEDLILRLQDYKCFYCGRAFGSMLTLKNKSVVLRLQWDHMVPFSYQQNNCTENFVAACHKCNSWKGSLIFQTIEDAQIFLVGKWDLELKWEAKRPKNAGIHKT